MLKLSVQEVMFFHIYVKLQLEGCKHMFERQKNVQQKRLEAEIF
jgi:hypothetical protein